MTKDDIVFIILEVKGDILILDIAKILIFKLLNTNGKIFKVDFTVKIVIIDQF